MEDVKQPTKPLTVRVPSDLHKEARLLSVEREEPLNGLIVKWIQSWVDHHRKEAR
jgi:predicted HicB family RNase H-like nuclease